MTTMVVVQEYAIDAALAAICNEPVVALDTETNITDLMHERYILGWSAYCPSIDTAYYFPYKHTEFLTPGHDNVLPIRQFTPKRVIFHNAKFDRQVFKNSGINLDYIPIDDTMVMSYVLDENPPHGLKELAEIHVSRGSSNDQQAVKALTEGSPPRMKVSDLFTFSSFVASITPSTCQYQCCLPMLVCIFIVGSTILPRSLGVLSNSAQKQLAPATCGLSDTRSVNIAGAK